MTKPAKKRRRSSDSGGPGLRSVLVPVDLKPASERVLGRVALLPLADDARVTLLHVVPASFSPKEQRSAARDAARALTALARQLRARVPGKIHVDLLVKPGVAAREIARAASSVGAELIVMGRGEGHALRDVLLGSTAERVVRQAKLPVLVVRLPPRRRYARPALALDLDEAAPEAVRLLLRVLPPPRPPVEVIHAYDIPYYGLIYPSLSQDEAERHKAEQRAAATHALAQLLAAALVNAGLRPEDGPVWKTHVRHGPAQTVVDKAVRSAESDLLVLGTHGHSGAAYMLLGTVAGELLRAAKCDVLMVPPALDRA